MNQITENSTVSPLADETEFDPIEKCLLATVRSTVEAMFEEELAKVPGRVRYGR